MITDRSLAVPAACGGFPSSIKIGKWKTKVKEQLVEVFQVQLKLESGKRKSRNSLNKSDTWISFETGVIDTIKYLT